MMLMRAVKLRRRNSRHPPTRNDLLNILKARASGSGLHSTGSRAWLDNSVNSSPSLFIPH
jgi:hypothetical protein